MSVWEELKSYSGATNSTKNFYVACCIFCPGGGQYPPPPLPVPTPMPGSVPVWAYDCCVSSKLHDHGTI